MERYEFNDVLAYIKEVWPRISMPAPMADIWWAKIGRPYTQEQVKEALSDYIEAEEKVPALAPILARLRSKHKTISTSEDFPFFLPPAYPLIEWIMDVLGVETYKAELKSIVGQPTGAGDWARLCLSKDWIPKYRAKVKELALEARQRSGISGQDYEKLIYNYDHQIKPGIVWKNTTRKAKILGLPEKQGPEIPDYEF